MKFILLFLAVILNSSGFSQDILRSNYTPTYEETIAYYKNKAKKHKQYMTVKEVGTTDIGLPLHLITITQKSNQPKLSILINNGIHPGEPDGINASIMLAEELLNHPEQYSELLKNVSIHIIPVYNVDGCKRRGKYYRANQNGPEESGFRGNYKNLDLNRDFIKMDSKNAFAFAKIFHLTNPHVMADTHVSNGADYQYTFTYFFTQKDKLPQSLQESTAKLENDFVNDLTKKNIKAFPYVNHHDDGQVKALDAFNDLPRYCTGYAALFNCIGITTETHMLKPFDQRVQATYEALLSLIKTSYANKELILDAKSKAIPQETINLNFEVDTTNRIQLEFLGYKEKFETSKVTGLPQLTYDRTHPVTFTIDYFAKYIPVFKTSKVKYFILPQAWDQVIARLSANNIAMHYLVKDSVIECETDLVMDLESNKNPYEGHYYHEKITTEKVKQKKQFYKGDVVIKVNDANAHFLHHVLITEAKDSYFRWNFFDACLQQKEWFSDYVFDKIAEELLQTDKELANKFKNALEEDKDMAKNKFKQLYFIYKNSKYYEKTAFELPVYRIF